MFNSKYFNGVLLGCFLMCLAVIIGTRHHAEPTPQNVNSEIVSYHEHSVSSQPRSPHWPTVRKHYIEKHPVCEACGSKEDLNVHHIVPFHNNPKLELEESNLITLCRKHHFELGHLRNWSNSNPNVRRDSERMRKKLNPNRRE